MTRKHQHLPQCNLTTSLVYLPSHLRQSHLRQSQLQHRHSKLCLRPLLMLRARLRGPQVEMMRGLQRKGGGRWFWRGLCMMMAPTGRNWTAFITTFSVASNSILWIFKSHTANTLSTKDPIKSMKLRHTFLTMGSAVTWWCIFQSLKFVMPTNSVTEDEQVYGAGQKG